MPNVIQNVDGFAIPLYNLTIHRRYSHQISKYSYEIWNFYYGNVSSEDFCQSESEELTLNCFRESFPNNSTGKLYYLTSYSPFLNNFTLGRDHLYLIDNQKYQFKLVSPKYYENTYRTADMVAIFASIGVFSCYWGGITRFKGKGQEITKYRNELWLNWEMMMNITILEC